MPGEHWCSECGEAMSKHGDTYVKLKYTSYKAVKMRAICPDCRAKKPEVDRVLTKLREYAQSPESKLNKACTLCGKQLLKSKGWLTIEYREKGKEYLADVCNRSLEQMPGIMEAFNSIKKPNPTFSPAVNCASAGVCGDFKAPGKSRGINCGNIVVNMDGELYCRRGHPGKLEVYRERWALPPNRKKILRIMARMTPYLESLEKMQLPSLDAFEEELRQRNEARAEALQAEPVPLLEKRVYNVVCYPLMKGVNSVTLEPGHMPIGFTFENGLPILTCLELTREGPP